MCTVRLAIETDLTLRPMARDTALLDGPPESLRTLTSDSREIEAPGRQ